MWEIVIAAGSFLIIGGVTYFRLRRPVHQKSELARKYKTLTDLLCLGRSLHSAKAEHKVVHYRFREKNDLHSFSLKEVENKLIVVWTLHSKIHGKRGKEWAFSLPAEQEKMFDVISSDIRAYQKSLFRERV